MTALAVTQSTDSEAVLVVRRNNARLVSGLLSVLAVTFVNFPAFAHDEYFYVGGQAGSTFTSLANIRDVGGFL